MKLKSELEIPNSCEQSGKECYDESYKESLHESPKAVKGEMKVESEKKTANWDWREHFVTLGSDVKSLFPSLSPDRCLESIRSQVEKSKLSWESIDMKELVLYIKLNEDELKDKRILNSIRKYLPIRKERSRKETNYCK